MTCWKVLLSHIAGFAAINAPLGAFENEEKLRLRSPLEASLGVLVRFGTLQQADPWRRDWQMAAVVVVMAALTMLIIQWHLGLLSNDRPLRLELKWSLAAGTLTVSADARACRAPADLRR